MIIHRVKEVLLSLLTTPSTGQDMSNKNVGPYRKIANSLLFMFLLYITIV